MGLQVPALGGQEQATALSCAGDVLGGRHQTAPNTSSAPGLGDDHVLQLAHARRRPRTVREDQGAHAHDGAVFVGHQEMMVVRDEDCVHGGAQAFVCGRRDAVV
jgi:hypothetical protein